MAKPSFLSPGSIVRTSNAPCPSERTNVGFVRRTVPTNGDEVLVTIVEGPHKGYNLSFRKSSLAPVE